MTALAILILAGITRFWNFTYPLSVVFDEVHFGRFVTDYWTGSYFFDIHPPFARLLISGFGYLIGASDVSTNWSSVGNTITETAAFMRFLPGLAGMLLPLVVYLICKHLKFSKTASVVAALLVTFENSLVVSSKFIMQDSILVTTGFAGILFYLKARSSAYRKTFLILSALLVSASMSSKWIGLAYLAIILVLEFIRLIRESRGNFVKQVMVPISRIAGLYVAIFAVFYVSIFAIHLGLLYRNGSGSAFMSQRFQSTLVGNKFYDSPGQKPLSFAEKFLELNSTTFSIQKNQVATHSYATKWYTWPIMQRGIYYWNSSNPTAYIYFLGNPLIYWLGTASIVGLALYGAYLLISRKRELPGIIHGYEPLLFIVFGYFINLLPFIPIARVMFLYHYEAALVMSIFGIAFALDLIRDHRKKVMAAFILVMAAFLLFIYFSPLTYGTPISSGDLEKRMWLSTWR